MRTQDRDIRDCMYMIFIVAVCTLLEYSFHGQTEKGTVKKLAYVYYMGPNTNGDSTHLNPTRKTNISNTKS